MYTRIYILVDFDTRVCHSKWIESSGVFPRGMDPRFGGGRGEEGGGIRTIRVFRSLYGVKANSIGRM